VGLFIPSKTYQLSIKITSFCSAKRFCGKFLDATKSAIESDVCYSADEDFIFELSLKIRGAAF
jgi:hypothetical protein